MWSGPDVCLPGILELDEGEGRPPTVLEIDEHNLAVFVEDVLNIFAANVRRQVADVNAGLVGHLDPNT